MRAILPDISPQSPHLTSPQLSSSDFRSPLSPLSPRLTSPDLTWQVGGFDPLLDDSVDFNTRIRRLGVPGELRIHRTLPHTFLSFPIWHAIPEVQQALATSVQWLEDALWNGKQSHSG